MATRRQFLIGTGAALGTLAMPHIGRSALDFSGKRITVMVPTQEGSGSTFHARLYAMALEKTLPGNPTIVLKNVDGSGNIRGINQFQKEAKPDGLYFAAIGSGTFLAHIVKDKAVEYDILGFRPILASPFGRLIYARTDLGLSKDDPVGNIRKVIEATPVYGGQIATGSDMSPLMSFDLLGIKPKVIFGLSNTESRAGFERGELNLKADNMGSWTESVKQLVDDGVAVPLFTSGFANPDGTIVRDPMLPDVPSFPELYEMVYGKKLEGIEFDVWRAVFAVNVMASKMFVLPAGTSQEIVDVYTQALDDALRSDLLNGDQAKELFGPYPQSTGAAAQAVFDASLSMTDENRAYLRDWLQRVHNVDIPA